MNFPTDLRNRIAVPGHEPPLTRSTIRSLPTDEVQRPLRCRLTSEYPAKVRLFGVVVQEILVGRGGNFPDRIPLLNAHRRDDCRDTLGIICDFQMVGATWEGDCLFSNACELSRSTYRKAAAGALRVSIGYYVESQTLIDRGETATVDGRQWTARQDMPLVIATRWHCLEASCVPIPADPLAVFLDVEPAHEGRSQSYVVSQSRTPAYLSDGLPVAGRRFETISLNGLTFHRPIKGHFR